MDTKPEKKTRGKPKKTKPEEIKSEPENVIVDTIPSEIPIAEPKEEIIVEEESGEKVVGEIVVEEIVVEEKVEEKVEKKIEEIIEEIVANDKSIVEEQFSNAAKTVEELEAVIDQFVKLVDSESVEPTLSESVEVKSENENAFEMKSLLNILILLSVRPELQLKYDLNPKIVKVISLILQFNSGFLTKIEDSFKKIVSDNKIDADDVPELMSLFSNVYEVLTSLKLKMKTVELSNVCGDVIKLIFNIMLTEKLITFENESVKNTTECFNALVDSSTSLIKLTKTMKFSAKCCFW